MLGLVVALVDGDPHTVAVDAQDLGDQLPGIRDGLGLEVVAETEVPQHLEEGAVALGRAHDVDVERAKALLHGGGTRPRRHLVTEEERFEGHHAGDGEQHRGIVGDQAGRRDDLMAARGEEAGEGGAKLVGVRRRAGGHDRES